MQKPLNQLLTCILLTFSLLTSLQASAQTPTKRGCFYTSEKAKADLKNNSAKILIQGGFAPAIYPTDKVFLEKYKIAYYIFGCVAPENSECLGEYNQAIFEYLDKTFGKSWRTEIRKDAVGLKDE